MRPSHGSIALLCLGLGVTTTGSAQSPAVTRIVEAAKASHTDALYLWKDGVELIDTTFSGEPRTIELMSAAKSVVALAIGRLLEEGKLSSIDQPVHTLFPEWKQGRKQAVTIKHLLNHTSGLQNIPNAGAEIYPAPDGIQLALAAELTDPPGAKFAYNNKATNLLAGVIEKASGQRMDLYMVEKLFQPLGISEYQWYFDRSGKPHGMAGLQLKARDAAKLGRLVLDRGRWDGKQLIPADYVDAMLTQSQEHYRLVGLLWWIQPDTQSVRIKLPAASRSDSPDRQAVLRKLAPLSRKEDGSRTEARLAIWNLIGGPPPAADSVLVSGLGADWSTSILDWTIGTPAAFYADGYLGQYIVVVPSQRVVAVRQIRSSDRYNQATDGFMDFVAMVTRLAPELGKGQAGQR